MTITHKAGPSNECNKYRPISILPVIIKMLEKAVHESFYKYLDSHNVNANLQSGLRHLHSTTTALVQLYDELLQNINNGKVNGAILIGLRKAFDTVNHDRILLKLLSYGADARAIRRFRSYLSHRMQNTHFKGCLSEAKEIAVGIPQGSI